MIRYAPSHTPSQSTPPATPTRCARTIAERMADDLRELAFAGQNTNPQALAALGYPADVVRRLGPSAVEIARRGSVRQIAEA